MAEGMDLMKKIVRCTGSGAGLGLVLLLTVTATANAQRTIPGYTRSDQSDVTGPSVTSGDQLASLFTEPGTILSMFCPVAWGVRNAAGTVQMRLTSADLRPALMVGDGSIGSTAQLTVLNLMLAERGDRDAETPVLGALTANNSRASQGQARRLVREVGGLFRAVEEMDPLNPGEVGPTQLSRAVGAYNGFVDASSDAFLMSPPDELAAVHAVLNQLVIASLENEGRPANPSVVDAAGLACAILPPPAPAPAPAPPPPPPPVEQAISICVLVEREFRDVTALRRPALGDTMVIVGVERRPLAEVYPNAREVNTPPWVPLGEPVTIGNAVYQPFGVTQIVEPNEVVQRGQVQGYDFYAAPTAPAAPTEIFFPVGPGCEVQPYRSAETIRVRG
jgi:hypothetical protein